MDGWKFKKRPIMEISWNANYEFLQIQIRKNFGPSFGLNHEEDQSVIYESVFLTKRSTVSITFEKTVEMQTGLENVSSWMKRPNVYIEKEKKPICSCAREVPNLFRLRKRRIWILEPKFSVLLIQSAALCYCDAEILFLPILRQRIEFRAWFP